MEQYELQPDGKTIAEGMFIEDVIGPDVSSVLILGHIRPDGDSVGSCLGLFHYLTEVLPHLKMEICLEDFDQSFLLLKGASRIKKMDQMDPDRIFDLCISCDVSERARLGDAERLFLQARHTICIDHHITNQGFAQINYIRGHLSSCAETLGQIMRYDRINRDCAQCLYLGVAHDTGVFKFSNTSSDTMYFAGNLMKKGFDHSEILDKTYYNKTGEQVRIYGRAMSRIELFAQGRISYTMLTLQDLAECGAKFSDLNGIPDQIRSVDGVEVAVFLYELGPDHYKASLRSTNQVDVSRIAAAFGGGGHIKAAGLDLRMPLESLKTRLLEDIMKQLPADSQSRDSAPGSASPTGE